MSKKQFSKSENRECVVNVGRRTMLEQFAVGGAALAAIGLSNAAPIEAAPESMDCGALRTVMSGKIRRVVTGCNADGKSKIVSDTVVDVASDLWKTAADQPLGPGPTAEPPYSRLLQSRFGIETLKPSDEPKPTHENRRGFHITPGVTHIFVLNGTITYMTDLDEVKLKAGDLVIQRNSAHAWRNDGTEPVRIFVTLVQ
jgi:mannose-6-phosphate isomerase-like protein (cupin superfamily)